MARIPKNRRTITIAAEFDKKVKASQDKSILFVQGGTEFISPPDVERLIRCTYAKILERIPHQNGQPQYKIEIRNCYADALYEGWPIIEVSPEKFEKPASIKPLFAKGFATPSND